MLARERMLTPPPFVKFLGVLLAFLLCAVSPALAYAEDEANGELETQAASVSTQAMYRLYNHVTSEHFYTASAYERDVLTRGDWNYEGVGWYAPTTGSPVYRLYNPGLGDHHYTPNKGERDILIRTAGWNDEGIGWYSGGSTPLYRQYNPGLKVGQHNYTTSAYERDVLVANHGWQDEGIGWYGYSTASTGEDNSGGDGGSGGSSSGGDAPEGIEYKPGVIELDYPDVFDYDADANTAKIADSVDKVHVGDTVAIRAGWVNGEYVGGAIKVTSISSTSPRVISGTYPGLSGYIESMETPEDNSTRMVAFTPANGVPTMVAETDDAGYKTQSFVPYVGIHQKVEVGDTEVDLSGQVEVDFGTGELKISAGIEGEAESGTSKISGSMSINSTIQPNIYPETGINPNDLTIARIIDRSTVDTYVESTISVKDDVELKGINVPIGVTELIDKQGWEISAGIFLHLQLDGSASLHVVTECDNSYGLGLAGFAKSNNSKNKEFQAKVDAAVEIGPKLKAEIRFGEKEDNDRIGAEIGVYISATGELTLHGDSLTCVDVSADLLISGSADILDWANAGFNFTIDGPRAHFENWQSVPECTWREIEEIMGNSVKSVAVGNGHTAAVKEDGTLWTWGTYSGLGISGSGDYRSTPIKIMDNVRSVALGRNMHGGAVKEDGTLWMWGYNSHGQLGDGTTSSSSTPIKIMDDVQSIALSYATTAAVKEDGTLWMWGWYNSLGQLGESHTPIKVMDNVRSVSIGGAYAAIKKDDSLWTWGGKGPELGNGSYDPSDLDAPSWYEPTKIMDDVRYVSTGEHLCSAIKNDGSLWTWGNVWTYGSLGDGTTTYSSTPIKIMDGVRFVSSAMKKTAIIKDDGSLYTWGSGQLGTDTTTYSSTPIKIMDGVRSVSAGEANSAAILEDGTLWMWGNNSAGQLGNGTTESSLTPIKVP